MRVVLRFAGGGSQTPRPGPAFSAPPCSNNGIVAGRPGQAGSGVADVTTGSIERSQEFAEPGQAARRGSGGDGGGDGGLCFRGGCRGPGGAGGIGGTEGSEGFGGGREAPGGAGGGSGMSRFTTPKSIC